MTYEWKRHKRNSLFSIAAPAANALRGASEIAEECAVPGEYR